jgi:methyl-accepting chemotaxis protein
MKNRVVSIGLVLSTVVHALNTNTIVMEQSKIEEMETVIEEVEAVTEEIAQIATESTEVAHEVATIIGQFASFMRVRKTTQLTDLHKNNQQRVLGAPPASTAL